MKKDNLFIKKENCGNLTVREAVRIFRKYAQANKGNEEILNAYKRLQVFVTEVEGMDPLSMFIEEEIPFRLKEIFKIENFSQELVDKINFDGLDDCEGYLDNEYMDNIITDCLRYRVLDLVEKKERSASEELELKEIQEALKERGVK